MIIKIKIFMEKGKAGLTEKIRTRFFYARKSAYKKYTVKAARGTDEVKGRERNFPASLMKGRIVKNQQKLL